MLNTFRVENLNGRTTCDVCFHPDLNIITGRNGSGKTTALKLLWYLLSGNTERIFPEMSFESVRLETDAFSISISVPQRRKYPQAIVSLVLSSGDELKRTFRLDGRDNSMLFDIVNRAIVSTGARSVFFPTFRRIEGGYTLHSAFRRYGVRGIDPARLTLDSAMELMSQDMSTPGHRFVASLSTQDIVKLLTTRFADVSEQVNRQHVALSRYITDRIRNRAAAAADHSRSVVGGDLAEPILQEIEAKVDSVTAEHDALLRPFSVLTGLVTDVLKHAGIQVSEGMTLGNSDKAIASDKLSAGEKQMLSFLVYNAFYSRSSIFIDEPELSLHADWQRILFPTLLMQEAGNQFIVATHSPFIYSKYPDRELILNVDKGGD